MNIENAKKMLRLLQHLTVSEDKALTSIEIGKFFFNKKESLEPSELRAIQRYLKDLSESQAGARPLIRSIGDGRWRRYYHNPADLANWLMSEETAHHLVLAWAVLQSSFGQIRELEAQQTLAQAEQVVSANERSRRLREKLRVVPDGLGRLPANINSAVLKDVIQAIVTNRQLRYEYSGSDGKEITRTVTVQGLVAKDGTIYLIGTEGLSDMPGRAQPLQRFKNTVVLHTPSQPRPDFKLDDYIKKTHQLSHSIDAAEEIYDLKLRVNPAAIFHFKERPLGVSQVIIPPAEEESWYLVVVKIPHTVLLVPFILSMGPWVEVVSPLRIRSEFISRLKLMNDIYSK